MRLRGENAHRLIVSCLAVAHEESAHLQYFGTSLLPDDAARITQLRTSDLPIFFGRKLDDGVRGFVMNQTRELTVFTLPGAATRSFGSTNMRILSVQCASGSKIFVSTWMESSLPEEDGTGMVLTFPSPILFLQF